mmetsp:Transcript_113591/g.244571  ORF Transcript_113591/g.244571 Transcript_113591/m.244571 type:complete len:322 (+) Transcript_113591:1249-2214(+)
MAVVLCQVKRRDVGRRQLDGLDALRDRGGGGHRRRLSRLGHAESDHLLQVLDLVLQPGDARVPRAELVLDEGDAVVFLLLLLLQLLHQARHPALRASVGCDTLPKARHLHLQALLAIFTFAPLSRGLVDVPALHELGGRLEGGARALERCALISLNLQCQLLDLLHLCKELLNVAAHPVDLDDAVPLSDHLQRMRLIPSLDAAVINALDEQCLTILLVHIDPETRTLCSIEHDDELLCVQQGSDGARRGVGSEVVGHAHGHVRHRAGDARRVRDEDLARRRERGRSVRVVPHRSGRGERARWRAASVHGRLLTPTRCPAEN